MELKNKHHLSHLNPKPRKKKVSQKDNIQLSREGVSVMNQTLSFMSSQVTSSMTRKAMH
jgi:hypothetical protein